MWNLLGDFARRVAFLTQDTQKNKADIKELKEQVQALTGELREVKYEKR